MLSLRVSAILVLLPSANRFALERTGNAKKFRDHDQAVRERCVEVSREATVRFLFRPNVVDGFHGCYVRDNFTQYEIAMPKGQALMSVRVS